MTRALASLALLAALAALASPTRAEPPPEIHYSPEERLDVIDVSLIGAAAHTIDLASYSLTDALVLDALNAAERRGVKIRIVLDPRERHDFARLGDLSDAVRIKRGGRGGVESVFPISSPPAACSRPAMHENGRFLGSLGPGEILFSL